MKKAREAMENGGLVVIPTYNERENVSAIIHAVCALGEALDVLVVDDSSPDGTAHIVRELMGESGLEGRVHLLEREGKQGLGTAYIAGFRWALGRDYEYVFEMDADFSHAPSDLPRLLSACRDGGYDVAVGSRYSVGVNVVNWPLGRVLMSYGASLYTRMLTGLPVKDPTAGFVCWRRKVLETIDLEAIRFKGYAFQIEMKFTAWRCGFRIKEVPIVFTNRRLGQSKMSGGIFSEALVGVLRLRLDGWTRKYPS